MKYLIAPLFLLFIFESCNSQQSEAKKLAKQEKALLEELTPGSIPTAEGGWMMKAKIKGKDWQASSMMPTEATGRIIGSRGKESISLPYDRRYLVSGQIIKFSDHQAVDIFLDDEVGIWGGRKGQMEITKVDGKWAEGKFYVTGSTLKGDKTVEVTEGVFRVSLTGKN